MQNLDTKIDAVTVYQIGARITRLGSINLTSGDHQIRIPRLSRDIDKDSVRVKGTGHGTIVNVNVEKHSTKVGKNPRREELQQQLKELKTRLQYIDEDFNHLKEVEARHKQFSDTFYSRMPVYYGRHGLEMSRIEKMETFLKKNETQVIESRRRLEKSREELIDNINMVQRELNQIGSSPTVQVFYEIVLNVAVSKESEFHFEIEFQIPNASWRPFYDVNLQDDNAHVKLLADVLNLSDEDWTDVSLEISSANLRPVKIIEPKPFIIRERKPIRTVATLGGAPKSKRKLAAKSAQVRSAPMMLEEQLAEPTPPPAPKIQQQTAQIQESVGVQSYKLPARLTIPADKNPHPVTLVETELKSDKGYFWSVSAPDLLLIRDKLTNKDMLLLPGKAKVYFNGEFIGESNLPLIAPKETVELGTRRSYDLKVDKKLKDRSQNKEGFLKGKISKHYAYEIKLEILNENSNVIKIMDRIAHSDSEKIKIANTNFSPEPTKQELGVLTWEISLEGKKKYVISYEYDVIWEKDVHISPPLP